MLSSKNRIRRSAQFGTAVRSGRRAGRPTLVAHLALPQPVSSPISPARAGFVVSRAVGPAVVRTRVKRRLRHLVRERLGLLPPGSLLVVRALPLSATVASEALAVDLDSALSRLLPPSVNRPKGGASRP